MELAWGRLLLGYKLSENTLKQGVQIDKIKSITSDEESISFHLN